MRSDRKGYNGITTVIVAVVILIASMSAYAVFFKDRTQPDITIAWANKDCYEPFWIADEMGFWDDEDVRVGAKILSNGSECMSAVMAGQADMGGMGADPLLRMLRDDDSASIITRYQAGSGHSEFVTYEGSNNGRITSQDVTNAKGSGDWSFIKGAKVGMQTGTAYWSWFLGFLENAGLSVSDVTIVPLNFNLQVTALNKKEVDIISGGSPNTEVALRNTDNFMFMDPKAKMTTICLMASGDAQENKGDAIVKVLKALQRACDLIYSDPDKAAQIMVEVYGRNWSIEDQKAAFGKSIWGLDMTADDFDSIRTSARLINNAGMEIKGNLPTDIEGRFNDSFMDAAGISWDADENVPPDTLSTSAPVSAVHAKFKLRSSQGNERV